jgi:transposase
MFGMRNFLSAEELNQLRLQHKKERDRRVCDRIKAILLYNEGWSHEQIAHVLLLTDEAIRQHIRDYETSQKLKPQSGGSIEKLSDKQSRLLENHLQEHTYLYIKDIIIYVKSVYKVTYTVSGMGHWLKRHAFSYKKPALVPGKANEHQQRLWIAEYEKLKQQLPNDETICFMDGVHPTHNTQVSYGWIRKGFRKELCANSGRSRLNLSGAIDLISKKLHIQEDKTLNAESTLAFLEKIEKAYPTKSKIHLYCDNARYYKNKTVMAYLEKSRVKLHFLPPYSPNLNPIERLWKWMKERVMYNTYYEYFEEFKSAIIGFLEGISILDPKSVLGKAFANRVRDKFRPIGAPVTNF